MGGLLAEVEDRLEANILQVSEYGGSDMYRKRFLLTVVLIPILVGCSIFSTIQPATPTPNSEDVPVISQAELEEIIAGISQKYGVPAIVFFQ